MSELQTVRKKIQGEFFLEKSYKNGKLFYEVLRYKDDYIGINYGYLEDKLSEETYINDNRIGMLISNEKEKIHICTLDGKRHEVGITVAYHNKSGRLAYEIDYLDDICMATNRIYKNDFIKNIPLIKDLEKRENIDKKYYKKYYEFKYKKNILRVEKIYCKKTGKRVDFKAYKNNKLYGFREVRDDNGDIILRGSYLNNKKVGIWHEYENNKVKIKVAFDENEKFSGIYREFFSNGDIKEEKYYFQGKEIEEEKT